MLLKCCKPKQILITKMFMHLRKRFGRPASNHIFQLSTIFHTFQKTFLYLNWKKLWRKASKGLIRKTFTASGKTLAIRIVEKSCIFCASHLCQIAIAGLSSKMGTNVCNNFLITVGFPFLTEQLRFFWVFIFGFFASEKYFWVTIRGVFHALSASGKTCWTTRHDNPWWWVSRLNGGSKVGAKVAECARWSARNVVN